MPRPYAPFVDAKGNFLRLSQVRYHHLKQLASAPVEQGYQIQFHGVWDDIFRKNHLCQSITSFANSQGGWLLIGVDERGNALHIIRQRQNYRHMVWNLLRRHVAPMPVFELRFLLNPVNQTEGILVIRVKEGFHPPYVCNGTVYVREGSSRLPVKAERADIDRLIEKRQRNQSELARFFRNDDGMQTPEKQPYCEVSVYHTDKNPESAAELSDVREWAFDEPGFSRAVRCAGSVLLFRGEDGGSPPAPAALRVYDDFSARLYVPFLQLPRSEEEGFTFLDGLGGSSELYDLLSAYVGFLWKQNITPRGFVLLFRFHHLNHCLLCFESSGGWRVLFPDKKTSSFPSFEEIPFQPVTLSEWDKLDQPALFRLVHESVASAFELDLEQYLDFFGESLRCYLELTAEKGGLDPMILPAENP